MKKELSGLSHYGANITKHSHPDLILGVGIVFNVHVAIRHIKICIYTIPCLSKNLDPMGSAI